MENKTLLAYQPIYDISLNIMAGELLYRNENGLSALDVGEEYATSELVFNLCTGIDERFEGFNHPLFINVSKELILSETFLPLEPTRVIIELVERIEPTQELIEAIARWHKKGFRFALDDFEYSHAWVPLIKYCDIIKIDIETTSIEAIKALQHELRFYNLTWLAERIETQEQLEQFQSLGFTAFQGYFLAHPRIISGQKISPAAANLSRLIELLYAKDVNIQKVTEAIANEPAISVKLLKVANSPFYRGHKEISSLQQALMRLGIEQLKKWVVLIASLEGSSSAAVQLLLTRANTCAELAKSSDTMFELHEQVFLAALLSGVDILFNIPKEVFLQQLELSESVQLAALKQRSTAGGIISMVLALEQCVNQPANQLRIRVNPKVMGVYLEQDVRTQQILKVLS